MTELAPPVNPLSSIMLRLHTFMSAPRMAYWRIWTCKSASRQWITRWIRIRIVGSSVLRRIYPNVDNVACANMWFPSSQSALSDSRRARRARFTLPAGHLRHSSRCQINLCSISAGALVEVESSGCGAFALWFRWQYFCL